MAKSPAPKTESLPRHKFVSLRRVVRDGSPLYVIVEGVSEGDRIVSEKQLGEPDIRAFAVERYMNRLARLLRNEGVEAL